MRIPYRWRLVDGHALFWRFLADRQGAIAVEAALILGLLLVPMTLIGVDLMLAVRGDQTLNQAVAAATQRVIIDPTTDDQMIGQVIAAATDNQETVASSTKHCSCQTVTTGSNGLTSYPVNCNATCDGNQVKGTYITVGASQQFDLLFADSITLSAEVQVRLDE